MSVRDHGKLVEIVAPHHFQSFHEWRLWGNRAEFVQGTYHGLQSCHSPFRTPDVLNLLRRDQAGRVAVLEDDEAPPTTREEFVFYEVLNSQPSVHRGKMMCHHIADPNTLERSSHADFNAALAGGLQEKPSNKADPQTTETPSFEVSDNAKRNEDGCHKLAGSRRSSS